MSVPSSWSHPMTRFHSALIALVSVTSLTTRAAEPCQPADHCRVVWKDAAGGAQRRVLMEPSRVRLWLFEKAKGSNERARLLYEGNTLSLEYDDPPNTRLRVDRGIATFDWHWRMGRSTKMLIAPLSIASYFYTQSQGAGGGEIALP